MATREDTLWRRIRRLTEPETAGETAALVGASMLPGVGTAADVVDVAAGIEDRDLLRTGIGLTAAALPIVSSAQLKALGRGLGSFVTQAMGKGKMRAPWRHMTEAEHARLRELDPETQVREISKLGAMADWEDNPIGPVTNSPFLQGIGTFVNRMLPKRTLDRLDKWLYGPDEFWDDQLLEEVRRDFSRRAREFGEQRGIAALRGALRGPRLLKAGPKIRAHHGSPHDFDKFDISKIGTGEGGAAFGRGLYFAENPDVAKHYRETLGDAGVYHGDSPLPRPDGDLFVQSVHNTVDLSMRQGFSPDYAIDEARARGNQLKAMLQRDLENALKGKMRAPGMESYSRIEGVNDHIFKGVIDNANKQIGEIDDYMKQLDELDPAKLHVRDFGKTYEVNIHADPEAMIDWDLPPGEQPAWIRDMFPGRLVRGEVSASSLPSYMGDTWSESTLAMRQALRGRGIEGPSGAIGTRYADQVRKKNLEHLMGEIGIDDFDDEQVTIKNVLEALRNRSTNPVRIREVNRYMGFTPGSPPAHLRWRGIGSLDPYANAAEVSAEFRSRGVPGIRYLDQFSRGAQRGSRNYLIFDDDIIEILRKYREGGLVDRGLETQSA